MRIRGHELGDQPAGTGWWEPHTSLVDWCEENYAVTPAVAEWSNTISNMCIIGVAWYGAAAARRYHLPAATWYSYCALGVIGLGSTAFHATLQWETQLLDELPMIWASCVFIYGASLERVRRHRPVALAVSLLIFGVGVTIVYVSTQWWAFFEAAYVCQVILLVGLMIWHCTWGGNTSGQRDVLWKLLRLGLGSYMTGFVLWQIDNNACPELKQLRAQMPGGPLGTSWLQLHAWWHAGTAYGTYVTIVLASYAQCCAVGEDPRIEWGCFGMVPYCNPGRTKQK